ncbi:hypothetical protein D3C86_2017380 [compost metagenome]
MEGLVQSLGAHTADRFVQDLLAEWRQFAFEGKVLPTEDDVTVVAGKLAQATVPVLS